MSLGNVVDELHDKHGLSHSGTAEETNLTTFHVRLEQVDNLDTRCKHFLVCGKILKLRCLAVDRISSIHTERFHTVDRLAYDVHHTALDLLSGGHHYR